MPLLADVPVKPRDRVLRAFQKLPRDEAGVLVATVEELEPAYRAAIKASHEKRIDLALLNRKRMRETADKSESFRRSLLSMCAKDPVFFCDTFVDTFDDELAEPVQPFVLYAKQRELVRFYAGDFLTSKARQMWFIEKSRRIGYSWLMGMCTLWSWLFLDGDTTLWGAVLVKDIDDGGQSATLDSHFGRIRYMLGHLPEWMQPRGIESDGVNKTLVLVNPEKPQNLITGKQFDHNLGRGKRKRRAILDEVAHSLDFEPAMSSLSYTTRHVIFGTTPKGRDTASARLRHSGRCTKVSTVHWTSNPNLDVEWYWGEVERLGIEDVASELDISYDLSAPNRIHKTFDPAVNVVDVDYDPTLPLHVAIDPGFDDPCAVLWIQPNRADKTYRIVDSMLVSGRDGEWLVPFLLGHVPKVTVHKEPWPYEYDADSLAMIERHGRWNPVDEAYGDQYGGSRTQAAPGSFYDLLSAYHFVEQFGGVVEVKHDNKIEAVQRSCVAMPRVRIAKRISHHRSSISVETVVDSFQQYEWVERESPTGREMKRAPKHNVFSHLMDAWQFYLAGKDEDPVDASCTPLAPSGRRDLVGIPDVTGATGMYVPDYSEYGGAP